MEFVSLMGSEDVREAGATMRSAAQEISQAAGSLESSLRTQRLYLDEFLSRFEEQVTRLVSASETRKE